MLSPNYSMSVAWSEEDEMFVAICPELGGVSALAPTYEKAVAELRTVIELVLASYEEDGKPAPEPRKVETHSGQLRLRLPRSLHASLADRADAEGVSLNTLIVSILSKAQGLAASASEIHDLRDDVGQILGILVGAPTTAVTFRNTAGYSNVRARSTPKPEISIFKTSDTVDQEVLKTIS